MCGEMKAKIENWRSRKQENAKTVDEASVYGECMPSEWMLQKMYKQMKIDNNNFITWLVESVYPCTEDLPPYITLSRKQAKGQSERDQTVAENAFSFPTTDHPKYEIIVNNFPQLARQINQVSPNTLALVDRVITERSEYTYWMSRKSTDQLSQASHDTHTYYIEVLKEVQTILAARTEPEKATPENTLGKRKNSATKTQGWDQRKAAKTANSTTTPKHLLRKDEARQQQWRSAVTNSYDNVADKPHAPLPKPMSYAAACRVAIIA